jgi:hypothetical protein
LVFPCRAAALLGCRVQIFQRQVAQSCASSGVALMNLLDLTFFRTTASMAARYLHPTRREGRRHLVSLAVPV